MSHDIEIRDGKAQMFSGEGLTPWHGLVTPFQGLLTAEEALKASGLDFTVRKDQAASIGPDGKVTKVPNRFYTVREFDLKQFAEVSAEYKVYQNEESFTFLNNITDTGGEAVYTSGGSLLGGARSFLVLKLSDQFTVGDNDAHDLYLMCTNSHDGKQGFTVVITPIRAVCRNTVTLGLKNAVTKWSVTHKKSLNERVQDARHVLELGFKYEAEFEKEIQKLMDIKIKKDTMFKLVDDLLPASPLKHDKDVEAIMNIWENEPTVKMGGGEGNGWGAFNAATFWIDHKDYRDANARFNQVQGNGNGMGLGERLRPKLQKMLMAMS